MNKIKNIVVTILLLTIILSIIPKVNSVERAIIYVDDDGGADYDNIQDAINNANPGDTIYVYNGTYSGSFNINKTLNINGESRLNTIIDGTGFSHAVFINADFVNLSNFTIRDLDTIDVGIWVNNNYSRIFYNIIKNTSQDGVVLLSSHNNIYNNIFDNNDDAIICSYNANNNTIYNNFMSNSSDNGIQVNQGNNNTVIYNNTIINNIDVGIHIYGSNNSIITNNILKGNYIGILLEYASNNSISNCKIYDSGSNIILVLYSNNNVIYDNQIFDAYYCNIKIEDYSNYNIIYNNSLFNAETEYGLTIWDTCFYNKIYDNNFFNNNINTDDSASNEWYNSTSMRGNYYDDYSGIDFNGDGIGDTPYNIGSGSNQDIYPLITPNGYNLMINILLNIGWNNIGWIHVYDTLASSIAENITGCLSVSSWDSLNQTYRTFIVGGPPSFDFIVSFGMGLFVDVTEQSYWHGDG